MLCSFPRSTLQTVRAPTNVSFIVCFVCACSSKTPQHAVFAGSMQLLAGIKLCTGRVLTNHPHYEDKELRDRTKQVTWTAEHHTPIQRTNTTVILYGLYLFIRSLKLRFYHKFFVKYDSERIIWPINNDCVNIDFDDNTVKLFLLGLTFNLALSLDFFFFFIIFLTLLLACLLSSGSHHISCPL